MLPKKNIVVFCDGTWLSPGGRSNVYNLFELLHGSKKPKEGPGFYASLFKKYVLRERSYPPHGAMVCDDYYYESGVSGVINGTAAFDLDSKIKHAYRHIVKRYNPEDKKDIWLFGFSRGAYTVRCVAGIIRNCGILKYDSDELIDRAYEHYRSRDPNHSPEGRESIKFQKSFSHDIKSTNIKFLGLWDTVGAYGFPGYTVGKGFEYKNFHDLNISKFIKNAYQVLSIHERFSLYEPCRIFRKAGKCGKCEQCRKNEGCIQDKTHPVEEVWFPGNHSVIGGGSSSSDPKLSRQSFMWMFERIKSAGGLLSEELSGLSDECLKKKIDDLFAKNKYSASSIFERLSITSWGYDIIKYLLRRDRIIPSYRDPKDKKLTFDLLHMKGIWDSKKFKNIKNLNQCRPNSLTKFYNVMEDVLVDEIANEANTEKDSVSALLGKIAKNEVTSSFTPETISMFNEDRIQKLVKKRQNEH